MYIYARNYTAGIEKVMLHTNKMVFVLMVCKADAYDRYCMFPTILICSPLNCVMLSRFPEESVLDECDTGINDTRELHSVMKRKFFMLLLYNIWKH